MTLQGKLILITGAAQRIGKALALGVARAGSDIILHFHTSRQQAADTVNEIAELGRKAYLLQADLTDLEQVPRLIEEASRIGPLYALINNAAIFEPLSWTEVTPDNWQRHLNLNLSAPFFLSQAFARTVKPNERACIVNMLDWRALRPGSDHLPYTITKAALAALTRSLAIALAPNITVNGIALGAILPPSGQTPPKEILNAVPAARWAQLEEVVQLVLFLLSGPGYITGEVIHLDGGRHLI